MARKSRKDIVVEEKPQKSAMKVWQAALYIRLSVEFNGKRGDSLETQRQIMEAYATLRPDIEIAGVYTDNGITGRTFEREAFQRLLNDVEAEKINCIIVKDLSRLGRNTIDTGYYIEKYFPLHGVRFIAVNDQFDSEDSDNSGSHLIVPLKNMINEAYAADISRKVKAQQRQAMRDGEFVGARPPYGYKKDPDNCHRLLVNEDTAPVVRQIFQWAAEGIPLGVIAIRLNERGILTPGRYMASIGIVQHQYLRGGGHWQTWSIQRILDDEVYVGDMVQGKTKIVGHKQIPADRAEWIVVHNTHEPLISRELFEQVRTVQKQTAENAKPQIARKVPYTENIFRGRIFCGHCGRHMNRHRDNKLGTYSFSCIANQRIRKGVCSKTAYIRETVLFDLVLTIIRKEAETVLGNHFQLCQYDDAIAGQKKTVSKEISVLQKETEKNRFYLTSLLESFNTGVLTEKEYIDLKAVYTQRISDAQERVQYLLDQQRTMERRMGQYLNLAELMAAINKDTSLSARLADQLIERVTVNGTNDVSIQFRFDSDIEKVMGGLTDE